MPSPNSVTITGKVGPGNSVTSLLFADVTIFDIDFTEQTINITYRVNNNLKTQQFSLSGVTSIADTITSTLHAIVIS